MLTRTGSWPSRLSFAPSRTFFGSFQRTDWPKFVLYFCESRIKHGLYDFFGGFVALGRFINRYAAGRVDENSGLCILIVNFSLRQSLCCLRSRQPAAGAVID